MTKAEQARLQSWRVKVLKHESEVTGNVSQTCRHFGISRQAFYEWKARHEKHGEAGLWDRSRRPHQLTAATETIMSDLMTVSDSIRRQAFAEFEHMAARRTNDEAPVSRPLRAGRNQPCHCGSKKRNHCCGAASRVH